MPILEQTCGSENAPLWWMRWRLFFMGCAEFCGFRDGSEWYVGHICSRAGEALKAPVRGAATLILTLGATATTAGPGQTDRRPARSPSSRSISV
jgi:hypothetical protein